MYYTHARNKMFSSVYRAVCPTRLLHYAQLSLHVVCNCLLMCHVLVRYERCEWRRHEIKFFLPKQSYGISSSIVRNGALPSIFIRLCVTFFSAGYLVSYWAINCVVNCILTDPMVLSQKSDDVSHNFI